ncbi:spore coat protein [Anaerolentibacter hominis]|uniref:spore coat protein n=1 Tax=Anaerolentibacter hominis TaxID=3079009 RepID=UPI0031B84FC8
MEDKNTMMNLLNNTKGLCDLYMHGTIESGTENVRCTFKEALDETLKMQDDIYKKMKAKGWYQSEQAEQQKMDQVKQSFSMK